jgi:hypothetical protein
MTEKQKHIDQQQALQLFDRGIISSKTLLESFDIDADQETKRKQEDATKIQPKRTLGCREETPLTTKSTRIEQARRNVEALSRMKEIMRENTDLMSIVYDSIDKNIKIMNEVSEIK